MTLIFLGIWYVLWCVWKVFCCLVELAWLLAKVAWALVRWVYWSIVEARELAAERAATEAKPTE